MTNEKKWTCPKTNYFNFGLVCKPNINKMTHPKIQTNFYYFSMKKTNNHQYKNLMPKTTRLYNSNQKLKCHQII